MFAGGEASPETCSSLAGVRYLHAYPQDSLCLTARTALTFTLLFPSQCIVGVAGGATRAALTMHQARRNNMADVSAKDSSQVSVKHRETV